MIVLLIIPPSTPYLSRLYIVRDRYGTDTEGIRGKYGRKGVLMVDGWPLREGKARSNHAFNRAQIGVRP
jgi:hypothetical protein